MNLRRRRDYAGRLVAPFGVGLVNSGSPHIARPVAVINGGCTTCVDESLRANNAGTSGNITDHHYTLQYSDGTVIATGTSTSFAYDFTDLDTPGAGNLTYYASGPGGNSASTTLEFNWNGSVDLANETAHCRSYVQVRNEPAFPATTAPSDPDVTNITTAGGDYSSSLPSGALRVMFFVGSTTTHDGSQVGPGYNGSAANPSTYTDEANAPDTDLYVFARGIFSTELDRTGAPLIGPRSDFVDYHSNAGFLPPP